MTTGDQFGSGRATAVEPRRSALTRCAMARHTLAVVSASEWTFLDGLVERRIRASLHARDHGRPRAFVGGARRLARDAPQVRSVGVDEGQERVAQRGNGNANSAR